MMERTCDVLVVGAGVVGCAAAHALVLRGFKTVLIDAGTIGGGTSSATFGWINATSKTGDPEYFQLNARGLDRYLDMARDWGPETVGLHQSGMIEWAEAHDAAKIEALRAAARQLEAWGTPVEWLEHTQLKQLEPKVRFAEGAEGLLVEGDCWLDVARFLTFLVAAMRERGADVIEHCRAVELLASDSGDVIGVQTETDQYTCPTVVVATGAHTPDTLSELTGYDGFRSRFPLQRAPGLLVTTPPMQTELVNHILYTAHSSGLHVRGAGAGRLLVGADDADGLVSESEAEAVAVDAARTLLTRLQRLLPDFPGPDVLNRCRMNRGVRAVPVDGRSIAGPALAAEGLYVIVTHSGITLAPILAELIADCIESGGVPAQLIPFNWDRFDA